MLTHFPTSSEVQITKVAGVRSARAFLITVIRIVQQELKPSCSANHVGRWLIAVALHRYVPAQIRHADELDVTHFALDALRSCRFRRIRQQGFSQRKILTSEPVPLQVLVQQGRAVEGASAPAAGDELHAAIPVHHQFVFRNCTLVLEAPGALVAWVGFLLKWIK